MKITWDPTFCLDFTWNWILKYLHLRWSWTSLGTHLKQHIIWKYLRWSLTLLGARCKLDFTWDGLGLYMGFGSKGTLIEIQFNEICLRFISMNFTWNSVQSALYLKFSSMNLTWEPFLWTLPESQFKRYLLGIHFNDLYLRLCSKDFAPDCVDRDCQTSSMKSMNNLKNKNMFEIILSLLCNSYALLMHFWCAFDALLMHFEQKFINFKKCIKSASGVHHKPIRIT